MIELLKDYNANEVRARRMAALSSDHFYLSPEMNAITKS